MKKFIAILITTFIFQPLFAQDLLSERIRKLTGRKKSIYFDKGIFHNGSTSSSSKLVKIRHNYSKKNGYERIVLDFETNSIPRVYGHISSSEKKIYLDLFNTKLGKKLDSFGNSKFIETINFFPIDHDKVSLELQTKLKVNAEVFYLKSPGRLIIDIRS
ncbi:MAG: hypothetical protein KC493_07780 [Bacteriovoracaceae bacterium]|nr:hypothetical protein [Bacteriovoracaceae bacterium]